MVAETSDAALHCTYPLSPDPLPQGKGSGKCMSSTYCQKNHGPQYPSPRRPQSASRHSHAGGVRRESSVRRCGRLECRSRSRSAPHLFQLAGLRHRRGQARGGRRRAAQLDLLPSPAAATEPRTPRPQPPRAQPPRPAPMADAAPTEAPRDVDHAAGHAPSGNSQNGSQQPNSSGSHRLEARAASRQTRPRSPARTTRAPSATAATDPAAPQGDPPAGPPPAHSCRHCCTS